MTEEKKVEKTVEERLSDLEDRVKKLEQQISVQGGYVDPRTRQLAQKVQRIQSQVKKRR